MVPWRHDAVSRRRAEPGDGMAQLGARAQRRRVALGPHDRPRRQAAPRRVHADAADQPVSHVGAPPAVTVGSQRQALAATRHPAVTDPHRHPGALPAERRGVVGALRVDRAPDGEDRDLAGGLRAHRLQPDVGGLTADQRHLMAPEVAHGRGIGARLERPAELVVPGRGRRPRPRRVGADRRSGYATTEHGLRPEPLDEALPRPVAPGRDAGEGAARTPGPPGLHRESVRAGARPGAVRISAADARHARLHAHSPGPQRSLVESGQVRGRRRARR
jgi:hypothetical protein